MTRKKRPEEMKDRTQPDRYKVEVYRCDPDDATNIHSSLCDEETMFFQNLKLMRKAVVAMIRAEESPLIYPGNIDAVSNLSAAKLGMYDAYPLFSADDYKMHVYVRRLR